MKAAPRAEPFWMDEPNPYARPMRIDTQQVPGLRWIMGLVAVYRVLMLLLLIAGLVLTALIYPIAWIIVAPVILALAAALVLPHFIETRQAKAARIQRRAIEILGTEIVGSAIHTAGHPSLQVDQPVVLALRGGDLSIYSYDSPAPLDTLLVRDLLAVDLVTFDDENTPHIGVISNSAQALQLRFRRQGITWTASFRRMYRLRPVEWYQALQKARLAGVS